MPLLFWLPLQTRRVGGLPQQTQENRVMRVPAVRVRLAVARSVQIAIALPRGDDVRQGTARRAAAAFQAGYRAHVRTARMFVAAEEQEGERYQCGVHVPEAHRQMYEVWLGGGSPARLPHRNVGRPRHVDREAGRQGAKRRGHLLRQDGHAS